MSHLLGSRLPDDLLGRLGSEPADGKALLICSVGDDGWPHPAMLSCQELIAVDAARLRLATYATSQTTRNLTANGVVTVMIVDEGAAYYVKGRATPSAGAPPDGHTFFDVHVDQVSLDAADEEREGEARIISGIRYAASDVHWKRAGEILRALRRT